MAELDGTPIKCEEALKWVNGKLRKSYKFGSYKKFQREWDGYSHHTKFVHVHADGSKLTKFVEYYLEKCRAKGNETQLKKRAKKKEAKPRQQKSAEGQPTKNKGTRR